MTTEDHEFDQLQDDFENFDAMIAGVENLTPFEDTFSAEVDDTLRDGQPLARKLRSAVRRFLIQLRIDSQDDKEGNAEQSALAAISRSISTFGGRVEHRWCTPREYDLILVMRLYSNEISIAAFEMALRSMPVVKSVHITPLLPLDAPPDDLSDDLGLQVDGERTSQESGNTDKLAVEFHQASGVPDSLEPGNT